jgi:hypothetical protein
MFNFEPREQKITKELLLTRVSEETYMEHYLGIPVKKGLFKSPLRPDNKPTASFFRNKKGDLIFHDFRGDFHGNFISVVMALFNCSYYKALKIIANDFNIVNFKGYEQNLPKMEYSGVEYKEVQSTSIIQIERKEFSQKELDWWESFGVSKKTLNKFKVVSCSSVFLNGQYFTSSSDKNPIFGYYGGKKDGIELWRIYMPTNKALRFLSNWSRLLNQGSKQLPNTTDHCILVKSLKDTMNLDEFNFTVCAPNAESVVITQSQFERLSLKFNNNLIVFFDNDLAGVQGAHRYKKLYNCRCVFLKRKYAKDISDMYKKVSSAQFQMVIDELNLIVANTEIRTTKHFYVF